MEQHNIVNKENNDLYTDVFTEEDTFTTSDVFIEQDYFTKTDDFLQQNAITDLYTTTQPALFNRQKLPSAIAVTILVGVLLIATVANGLVLFLTKRERESQEAYVYIRAVYAVVDILLVWSTVPFILVRAYYDTSDTLICYVGDFGVGMFLITVHLTILVAIERYCYFCHPMKYPRFFNAKSIAIMCTVIIIFNQVSHFDSQPLHGVKLTPINILYTVKLKSYSILVLNFCNIEFNI